MTASTYKSALTFTLAFEGGYSNHRLDPGGPTFKGVTQRVYDAYRKLKGQPMRSVAMAEPDEIAEIYKKQYANLIRYDDLPAGLDFAVFDFAVNSGVSRAIRYLQRVVNVPDDGSLGQVSMEAIYKYARKDEEALISFYCAERLAFLKSLKTFPTFGKGWKRRVIGAVPGAQLNDDGVIDLSMKLARGDTAFVMPSQIGKYEGEVPGKAESDNDNEFPGASGIDLSDIANANDLLSIKIAMDKIANG